MRIQSKNLRHACRVLEKKFNDHLAKGKDAKHYHKIEKRAEKMEKWAEWALRKSIERHEKRGGHRERGRGCGTQNAHAVHATPAMEQY